ncbi:MAG TPA: ATP-binding cassette domain-containing protein [Candidatus Dojkabacteria bacterium]|nr:ATP-binding cassette domain-containing protein [Candidatus Dojkabacteria bacterium]HRO65545.1 ATP-binding cassette domain-containing protein [Candidatus Dojkabacteria bacterium]HRP36585.1 ATP-binding cassette domain-containing protein [Candidatus Dojkabacteria bacterium]HRP51696.1 ATP-binding cassette domain-containing protein [Candidatus Dojkabacteria bacterium]
MIKVKSVSKKYGDTIALDNVSFSLQPGVIYGFLGPNGAGKTTAMRIMTGYLFADSGSISYESKDLLENKLDISSKIGYLPENNPLYDNMRVDEFLLMINNVKNSDKDDLKKLAVECGLTSVLKKEINELSKGYKQRVGLAKALIGSPEYLILDEPSTGLDPNQKSEILELIKNVGKEKTVLFSSHVLSEVESIADELIIINKGEIVASGKASEISKKHIKGTRIIVESDANLNSFREKLVGNKSIMSIELSSKSKTFNTYEVISTDPETASIDIYKTAVKSKWILRRLNTESNNLENLFKQLTK